MVTRSSMPQISWKCGERSLPVGQKTLIMGVLNVTPDSFSDGGAFLDARHAVDHALAMLEQGADILDIGGESTRPGATPVSSSEELDRVAPVLQQVSQQADVCLSIDTTKASVAEEAVRCGAAIINDVSGFTQDPAMVEVASRCAAGLVVMHMQGRPQSMQDAPQYAQVVEEVGQYFAARITALTDAGVDPNRIALDPGIGFGKTLEHNLSLINGLEAYKKFARPLLVGLSRKRFLGTLTGQDAQNRLYGGLAASTYAVMKGAHILRVHDVAAVRDAVNVVDALREEDANFGTAGTDHSC